MWQGTAVVLGHFKVFFKSHLIGMLLLLASGAFAADESGLQVCPASEEYVSEVQTAQSYQIPTLDFSCVSDIPSIQPHIASYQLVDIRAAKEDISPLSNAWQMSVSQLKHKHYLKRRPLLLLGSSFSRAESARHCSVLKSAGFEKVKFLAGGHDAWLSMAKQKKRGVNPPTSNVVSAQEVLFEYFNSKVVLIAASQEVVNLLQQSGLKDHYLAPTFSTESITDIAIKNSGGGFYPVVLVNDVEKQTVYPNPLPNVYVLDGGIAALLEQTEKNRLANIARHKSIGRSICENP